MGELAEPACRKDEPARPRWGYLTGPSQFGDQLYPPGKISVKPGLDTGLLL